MLQGRVEIASDSAYERVFRVGNEIGFLRVTHAEHGKPHLRLKVFVGDPTSLFVVSQKVRQTFDLDSDPILVANSFRAHKFLESLWMRYPGLRLARRWDAFETAVCTILGQLVSVPRARKLVAQLVESYGERIVHPLTGDVAFLFPTPQEVAKSDLLQVRTTEARRAAIREFARQVVAGNIDLLAPHDADVLRRRLLAIRGIGPWSAEYISLRALGDADAFPATDLILKRALEKHRDMDLEKIRPWRTYAAVYLWRHYAHTLSKKKGKG